MGIELFKEFGKTKTKVETKNYNVLGYTRVSSREQLNNNSLAYQKEAILKCIDENHFNLIEIIGGTYESASGDFTRKEFVKLIDKVKRMRTKPYAIVVFKMSRFSRTGGNAIGLANELIEGLGVHFFEVQTGLNTTTEQGKLQIYQNLLEAKKENIIKLSQTVPGMVKHLEKGNWLGKVPRGYDHYGPKVTDFKRLSQIQEIKINSEGKIFQQAWNWKLQGERDCVIINRLTDLGIEIKKQALSEMWRNPFYCGISSSKMLEGKVVNGNWEKIVSEQDFLFVQEILKGNRQGYKHSNSSPLRPLNGFIKCIICDQKLTGYEVKNKRSHYYKCQKCLGVSINVATTPKAKGIGANDLFRNLLSCYQLPEHLLGPFKSQLELTYSSLNNDIELEKEQEQRQLEKLELELNALKRRYASDLDIDKEIYLELKTELEGKISVLQSKIEKGSKKISNLSYYINISAEVAQNISKYWCLEGLETKKRIQELVFPDGLVLDTKNRVYLTKKVNSIFQQSAGLARVVEDENEDGTSKKLVPSVTVPESRLELPSAVADMNPL